MDPSDSGQNGGNLVGIWWEWGWSPSKIWVGSHWNDIPTKFLPFLPFCLKSAWIQVESVGEGKVLHERILIGMLASTVSHLVVYSTCLGKYLLEEGYVLQDNAHVAFLIPKGDDNKGYLEFNYVTFLENVWPGFLKAETYMFKLVNAPAVINC